MRYEHIAACPDVETKMFNVESLIVGDWACCGKQNPLEFQRNVWTRQHVFTTEHTGAKHSQWRVSTEETGLCNPSFTF